MDQVAEVDRDQHVLPGANAGEILDFFASLGDPPELGTEPSIVYGRAGADGPELTAWVIGAEPDVPRPGIVLAHGGGWTKGDPAVHLWLAHALAARGYVVAIIIYRYTPDHHWPEPLEDVRGAVRWMRAESKSLGVDPDRIALIGASAGGHLAALSVLAGPEYDGDGGHPGVSSHAGAAVLLYPATDLEHPSLPTELGGLVDDLIGATGPAPDAASPVHHVRADAAPILTLTGGDDILTPLPMIADFHAALDKVGAPNRLDVFDGEPHGFDLSPHHFHDVVDRIDRFLAETL
jgi:acetyl esterase/lipase